MIHGGKMRSEKEGVKPAAVTALQNIAGACEPCKRPEVASLNLGI